ncbi:MAG: Rieske 2Fe-2S domain-containing protein [Phycisphaerales bacterium JB043]
MSVQYRWVQWNRHKRVYDRILIGAVVAYLVVFIVVAMVVYQPPGEIAVPVLMIRALGTCAIALLHVILAIGPLARLTPLAAPLLYNRRHMGVMFFAIALLHALLSIGFYGGFGDQNPVVAVIAGYSSRSATGIPFEFLGFFALVIFALMAATSHDFWLKNLGPSFWKSMHMMVYVAYALVVAHVAFGALQSEKSIVYPALILLGVATLATLHIVAGVRELRTTSRDARKSDWVPACKLTDLQNNHGHIISLDVSCRVAIFRQDDEIYALSNVCAHQGGPLGEGAIVDGCVTCPWHGYQYKPEDGQSPPPYTEKIETYAVRIQGEQVEIRRAPNAPGTPQQPARVSRPSEADDE